MKNKIQQWEYRCFQDLNVTEMDKLGLYGWELVSTIYQPETIVFHFKRPLLDTKKNKNEKM